MSDELELSATYIRVEQIGDATLYLGDCRDVLPTLADVDAMVTDPPYGIGLKRKTSDYRDSQFFDHGASLEASIFYADEPEDVRRLISDAIPLALSIAKRAVIFPGPAMLWHYPAPASIGSVFTPNGAGRTAWGFQCTHPVLFYGKDPFLQDGLGARPNSMRTEQPNNEKVDHPCAKPVQWMKWAVWRGSRSFETILDPFMGSGSTGVACAKLGRRFVGIEIEPHYFDIACRRIEEAQRQGDLFISRVAQ